MSKYQKKAPHLKQKPGPKPRKEKAAELKSQNPPPLKNENENSVIAEVNDSAVAVQIETHGEEPESFGSKFKRVMESGGVIESSDSPIDRKGKKSSKADQSELRTLVVSFVTLALAFSGMPESIKPNQPELEAFTGHLSAILVRHMPVTSKFSADAVDVIGIVAIMSIWYARVAPEIKALREARQASQPSAAVSRDLVRVEGKGKQPERFDQVRAVDSASADFLSASHQEAESRGTVS